MQVDHVARVDVQVGGHVQQGALAAVPVRPRVGGRLDQDLPAIGSEGDPCRGRRRQLLEALRLLQPGHRPLDLVV
jgi:hypothetical protein